MLTVLDAHGIKNSRDFRPMRQSTLGTADTCMKRLQFLFDPTIPYGTGEFRIVGTSYHAGLELYYGSQGTATREECIAKAYAEWRVEKDKSDYENIVWNSSEQEAYDRVAWYLNFYFDLPVGEETNQRWDLKVWEVMGVEVEIYTPIPWQAGWAVKGSIDLVLRHRTTGQWVLHDHKTATSKWDKNKHSAKKTNQPGWYIQWFRYCMIETQGFDPGIPRFCFGVVSPTKKGGDTLMFEQRYTGTTENEIKAILAKSQVLAAVADNNGPYYPNQQSFLCSEKWCDFWKMCEFGDPNYFVTDTVNDNKENI